MTDDTPAHRPLDVAPGRSPQAAPAHAKGDAATASRRARLEAQLRANLKRRKVAAGDAPPSEDPSTRE